MRRQHKDNVNTPDNYDAIYFGERTTQLNAYPYITQLLPMIVTGGKVLDIGCGVGRYFPYLRAARITGIDFTRKILDQAERDYAIYNPRLELVDIAKEGLSPYDDNSFDFVFCAEVIEHLEHPNELINEINRVLVPGGIAIVTTPYQDRIVCAEHLWEFDFNDLRGMFSEFRNTAISRYFCVYEADWEHFLVLARK